MEALTRRSMQLLRMLYEKGKSTNTYTLRVKQEELAKQLGISRQALNVHLRKLRDLNYIRTGRGFIDVTENGLNVLGIASTPTFIFIKVSPLKRMYAYEKIKELTVQRAFRIAGDVDAVLIVDREKLDEALKRLSSIDGIQDTKSYVTIETIK
ncbi:MAG: Lrp/AsnC family transcriptional regulator [Candidatus Bathyarchaeota archaeon]|nr:Lrp/AsnC family transcriptional regulator [Candidatus Bathyarchaeota archaeon]